MSKILDISSPKVGIWLINLPRSTDRLRRMEIQINALGLAFDVFEAIDGQSTWDHISQQIDIPAFQKNVGREVMPGEIGCYLSHIGVWQAFLDSEHDVALILEDDVVLHDDFLAALHKAVSKVNQWDMLKLNRIRAKFPVKQDTIGDYRLSAFVGTFTGTGAYLITRSCAKDLLPSMLPISRPIDHALDWIDLRNFRHFALQPFPSHVDDQGTSTITGVGFCQVNKFPIYQRTGVYRHRGRALVVKALHLMLGKIGFFGTRRLR